jgi:CDP-glycerol glycerophosphotransferase
MRLGRIPGLRQVPAWLRRVDAETVLFESWQGAYSDNPRAISEGLTRRRPDLSRRWATEADGLPPNSRQYLAALGRARYLVTNLHMPAYYRKKPGTLYLQTWHGTPLKRIGFDIGRPAFPARKRFEDDLRRDVARWDVLISPNRFSTDVFRRAFGYDGRIVETGYPRNDVLRSPEAGQIRETVRRRLGLSNGTRAVLYAPTWRDNESFSLELDLEQLRSRLGDGWIVLLRAHTRVADTVDPRASGGAVNVSAYPDIRDLYLAADVLVTDYSSVMFDFAVTGKPMLFYTYDLAEYRDEIRGFYFDFEREAPGPLLATTEEVTDALEGLDSAESRYAEPYAQFLQRFCYLEDGRASERVIDAVFTD